MLKIDHLSHSSISTYLLCPLSWKFHYMDNHRAPANTSLVMGSAWHDMAEDYAKGLITNLEKGFCDALDRRMRRERIRFGPGETLASLKERGKELLQSEDVRMALDQLRALTDPMIPNCIEREVYMKVSEVPVPVKGYIDVLQKDGIPADIKTTSSKKGWDREKAEKEYQPLVYLGALAQAGLEVPGKRFRHYTFNFTTGGAIIFDVAHTDQEIFEYMDIVRQVWRGIEAEVFTPHHGGGWKCSKSFCDHWDICTQKGH